MYLNFLKFILNAGQVQLSVETWFTFQLLVVKPWLQHRAKEDAEGMEKFSRGKWNAIRIISGSQKANKELNIIFEEVTQESSVAIITFGYVQEGFGFCM